MRWIVLIAVLAALGGCADGSSIVTGRQRPEIPVEAVTLYLQPPASYATVGLVEATSVIGVTKQQDMDMAVKELKRRAAKMGANGVLLQNTASTTGTNSGYFYSGTSSGFWSGGYANTASVSGVAIHVPTVALPAVQGTAPRATTGKLCQPEKMIYSGC